MRSYWQAFHIPTLAKHETKTHADSIDMEMIGNGPALSAWIYAVVGAATVLIIVLAVVLYRASEYFHKGPRPRRREEQGSLRSVNDGDVVAVLASNNMQSSFHSEHNLNCNHSSTSDVTMVKACNDETESVISIDHMPSDIVGPNTVASCLHAVTSSELVSDFTRMYNTLPACSMLSSSDVPLYSSAQSKYLSPLIDSSQRKNLDQGHLKRCIPQILVTDCGQNTYYSDSEVIYSFPHHCMNSIDDSIHKKLTEPSFHETRHFKAEDLKMQTDTEETEIQSIGGYELDSIPLRIMDSNSFLDDLMEKISHIVEEKLVDENAEETSFISTGNDKMMVTCPTKCHDSSNSDSCPFIAGSAHENKANDCDSYLQVRDSASSGWMGNSGLPVPELSFFHLEKMDVHINYLDYDTLLKPTISHREPETDHPPVTNNALLNSFSPAELFQENCLKYNSIDTEPSTSSPVPLTSVSCESLQSSDENDLTSDVSLGEELKWERKSQKKIGMPPRNIAINSLTRRKYKQSFLKHSSSEMKDSGVSIASNETTPCEVSEVQLNKPSLILSCEKKKGHVLVGVIINEKDDGKQSEPGGFEHYEMDSQDVSMEKQSVITETWEETPLMMNGTRGKSHSKTDRCLAANSLASGNLKVLSSAETKRLLFASKS